MAAPTPIIFRDAVLTWGGLALTDALRDFSLTFEAGEEDVTCNNEDTIHMFPSLKKWTASGKILTSVVDSGIDETLYGDMGSETSKVMVFKAKSTATGPTNPTWTGTGYLTKYDPFPGGGIGKAQESPFRISAASDLVRAEA